MPAWGLARLAIRTLRSQKVDGVQRHLSKDIAEQLIG